MDARFKMAGLPRIRDKNALSLAEARCIALAAQGFAGPRPRGQRGRGLRTTGQTIDEGCFANGVTAMSM